MNILIINRLSGRYIDYFKILKANKNVKSIILFSEEKRISSFKNLNEYDHFEVFDSDSSEEDVFELASTLIERFNVNKIISLGEYDIQLSAKLREKYSISGQLLDSANAFRDKVYMKDILKDVVKVPTNSRIHKVEDIMNFISDNGFPIVIKPIDGAGSQNVYIIKNNKALMSTISNILNIEDSYEVEEFIEGDIYTIDGIVHGGNILFYWYGKYINDTLSFNTGKQASNAQVTDNSELKVKVYDFISKIIEKMPKPDTFTFHCEFFLHEGEITLCEIASRTGGGGVNETSRHIYGVELNELLIKLQTGMKVDISNFKKSDDTFGWTQIPPKDGELLYIPLKSDIPFDYVVEYIPKVLPGMKFKSPKRTSHKIAVAIIKGRSTQETIRNMIQFEKWIEDKILWKK